MRQAVILAGGLGTRLLGVTHDLVPKVMVEINGRPFIDYKLMGLKRLGVDEVVILTGHLGEQISRHVSDGAAYGLAVTCVQDGEEFLGTGGAVAAASPFLAETFWVTYGDSHVVADLELGEKMLDSDGLDAVMTVLACEQGDPAANTEVQAGRVTNYKKAATPGTFVFTDYGLLLFRSEVFARTPPESPSDLSAFFGPLLATGAMGALEVTERFWDIGTPESLAETTQHFREITWASP